MALPLIVEPEALAESLGGEELLIVDLCNPQTSASAQVPGAVHLDYASIIASRPPVAGLLPGADQLSSVLSSIGLTGDHHVVAYDDEGGGKAGRLLWTLDMLGHVGASLLKRHVQRIQYEVGLQVRLHRPTDHTSAPGIDDNG